MKKSGKDAFFWTKRLEKAEISLRPSIFANFIQFFFAHRSPCLTRSCSSARFASFHLSIVPTRYPVIRRIRSNPTPSPNFSLLFCSFIMTSSCNIIRYPGMQAFQDTSFLICRFPTAGSARPRVFRSGDIHLRLHRHIHRQGLCPRDD